MIVLITENGMVVPNTAKSIVLVETLGGIALVGKPKVEELNALLAELSLVGALVVVVSDSSRAVKLFMVSVKIRIDSEEQKVRSERQRGEKGGNVHETINNNHTVIIIIARN